MSCNKDDFQFLCSAEDVWGIVLETLAAAGAVFTIALMVALLIMVPRICGNAKKAIVPIQVLFLIGTLGIFGLTFAFIIKLNLQTCPTRFFLFGVLFAICFSCLLVHASQLVDLVKGKVGMQSWLMVLVFIALFAVQVVIAILYVALYLRRDWSQCNISTADLNARNIDFVLILIYVMLLIAVTFLVSMISMCGPCKYWKRHSAHIFVTIFSSIAIWVTWIVMLLIGNASVNQSHQWDDPVRAIALVANGWVFLLFYMVPELCLMTRHQPGCCDQGKNTCSTPIHVLRQSMGVDNQVFTQESSPKGPDSGRSSPSTRYDTTLAMREIDSSRDFTIPRPETSPNSFLHYRTHDLNLT